MDQRGHRAVDERREVPLPRRLLAARQRLQHLAEVARLVAPVELVLAVLGERREHGRELVEGARGHGFVSGRHRGPAHDREVALAEDAHGVHGVLLAAVAPLAGGEVSGEGRGAVHGEPGDRGRDREVVDGVARAEDEGARGEGHRPVHELRGHLHENEAFGPAGVAAFGPVSGIGRARDLRARRRQHRGRQLAVDPDPHLREDPQRLLVHPPDLVRREIPALVAHSSASPLAALILCA